MYNIPKNFLLFINLFLTFYTAYFGLQVFTRWVLMEEDGIKNFKRFLLYKHLATLMQIVFILILVLDAFKSFVFSDMNIGDYTIMLIAGSTYLKLLLKKSEQLTFKPTSLD